MADKHHRKAQVFLQVGEQVQNLRTNRNVESRSGLVGDDGIGLQRQSTGNGNALTLTARHLARQSLKNRARQTDHFDKLFNTRLAFSLRANVVNDHGVKQLIMNGHAGIQRRGGVLEDDRNNAADGLAHIGRALRDIDALEVHFARRRSLQAAHNIRRSGLAAARLADNTDGFARHELNGEPINGGYLIGMQNGARARIEHYTNIIEKDDRRLLFRIRGFGHYCSPPYGVSLRRFISSLGSSAYQWFDAPSCLRIGRTSECRSGWLERGAKRSPFGKSFGEGTEPGT